jgi:catechol 2,3-dioxygenase-like lactoylglutathione lyase family enzyme
MIDHITLHVHNTSTSLAFYDAALRPLGYIEKVRHGETVGLGEDDGTPRADFYIAPALGGSHQNASEDPHRVEDSSPITHLAFRAKSQDEVRAFYDAALAAGGTDNGGPGLRDYHPGYYSAFVLDPDGNNVEAVVDWSHASDDARE